MSGINSSAIHDLPIAVVDVETTGLHPRGDRIVEIAIARVEPGGREPKVVLETLVNPGRKVSATEIHGISDDDVKDAPNFGDLAPAVAKALEGAVFAAYNVYFDAKFVAAELARFGVSEFPPHLCLMYMRPMLDIGGRCSLDDACRQHGVRHHGMHVAADDALASANLWISYLERMRQLQIRTFGDLATRKTYKFTSSFSSDPLAGAVPANRDVALKSRWLKQVELAPVGAAGSGRDRRAEYWDTLKTVLADSQVTPEEASYLAEKRRRLNLEQRELRALHARAFAGILADVTDDHEIDDAEVMRVAAMAEALRHLGWSPGDALVATPSAPEPPQRRSLLAQLLGR